jgi:hypothetical protein
MTIPEIKDRLSIETVLKHYGITINRNGHIQCPFHDDKTASAPFAAAGIAAICKGHAAASGLRKAKVSFSNEN